MKLYQTTALLLFAVILASCTSEPSMNTIDRTTVQDSTNIAYTIDGLDGPEAVRYEPEQKVYFISNFTGGGNDQDSTGFITKADTEGNILELKFMTGTTDAPLHAPRGMFIIGQTLYAADVLGVHGFDIVTGEQNEFIDFSQFNIGFLNDVSADENGSLYITDTGHPRVYKIENGVPAIFIDSLDVAPNGITLNASTGEFVLAPWGGSLTYYTFDSDAKLDEFNGIEGGYVDGIEYVSNMLVSANQQDSTIRIYDGQTNDIKIHTTGRPADIGINTHQNHIAVPYIALDRVDIWDLNK